MGAALTLYFAPNTCALVPLMALETTEHPYELGVVAFMRGDHRSPAFLAMNPKGSVPALVVDGEVLTENVAILSWLAARFPESGLLPTPDDPLERARVLADLAFLASSIHPLVTRLRIPHFFCDLPGSEARVFALAEEAMHLRLPLVERRLAAGCWWYGERWSTLDAYANWVWLRVTGTAFDVGRYPALARHDARMRELPPVRRAYARNGAVADELEAAGLAVRFGGAGAVRPAADEAAA